MLVECATTSTNNGSINITSSSTTSHTVTSTSTSNAVTSIASTRCTSPNNVSQLPAACALALQPHNSPPVNTATLSAISGHSPLQQHEELSSGSNSCCNSIGNSISTTSNSISNSNSIGTGWHIGNNSNSSLGGLECNGRGSADKSRCPSGGSDLDCNLRGVGGSYSSSTPSSVGGGRAMHPLNTSSSSGNFSNPIGTPGCKYGSPLSDYKYFKSKETGSKSGDESNSRLVDVETCLANTPPHLLIRSLSSLSHHSSQLSTLPRSPEQEQVCSPIYIRCFLQFG